MILYLYGIISMEFIEMEILVDLTKKYYQVHESRQIGSGQTRDGKRTLTF